ncbi:hypothetical protein [Streptomyces sp. NBC_01597]|uniref:hypothetical protein n=1 Tax=Streptomyces sp. NBC_01597 TaxID=2975891 RepID=UPI00386F4E95
MTGTLVLVGADLAARTLAARLEVPAGALTALVGGQAVWAKQLRFSARHLTRAGSTPPRHHSPLSPARQPCGVLPYSS